jgi:hypothetical protein
MGLLLLIMLVPFLGLGCGDGDSELARSLAGVINGQVVEVDRAIDDLPDWAEAEEADVGSVFPVLDQVFPEGLPIVDILENPGLIQPSETPRFLEKSELAISIIDGDGVETLVSLDEDGRFSIAVDPEEIYIMGIVHQPTGRYLGPVLFGEGERETTILTPEYGETELGQIRPASGGFRSERTLRGNP